MTGSSESLVRACAVLEIYRFGLAGEGGLEEGIEGADDLEVLGGRWS